MPRLMMITNLAGLLQPVTEFPNNLKTKSCYFIRKKKEVITMENFRDVLMFGDMSPKPVEELAVLTEEVFVPILTNPANQKGWPKIVAEDVMKHIYSFRNNVYQVNNISNKFNSSKQQ